MGVSEIVVVLWTAVALMGHLLFFNSIVRRRFRFHLQHAFIPLLIVGGVALLLSILAETSHYAGYSRLLSDDDMLLLDALTVYAITVYFLLVFATLVQFILTQKRKKAYRAWRIFNPLLVGYALVQTQNAFFPPHAIYVLWIFGVVAWLPLLLQLRWIAVLDTRNKWWAFCYMSAINLLSIIFVIQLLNIQLPYIVIEQPMNNLFMLLLITAVLSYGIMSWLALVFGMPVASFIAEQRIEIESFQTLSRSVQNKVSSNELLRHLFETCLKNTASDAGWLVIYAPNGTETIETRHLSSEQVGFLQVKSNFKELIRTESAYATKPQPQTDLTEYIDKLSKATNSSEVGSPTAPMRIIGNEIGKGATSAYYFPYLTRQVVYNEEDTAIKSMLIVPVYSSVTQQLAGIVCLCKSFSDGYNDYMMELAKSYVAQAQLSLEHLQLVSETVQAARYKREWEIASRVQQALMPKQFPETPYCDIAGFTEPAVEVGGDYYDYARPTDNSIALIMGDVSGKGASAAFYMAQMKGIFQTLMQFSLDAQAFMLQANHAVAKCLDRKHYITVAYLLIDFDTRIAIYSRAGHCPMVHYVAETNTAKLCMGQGTGLGVIRNENFADFIENIAIPLQAGDILLLYTDGLVEGRLKDSDEQYGYERLKKCLVEHHALDVDQIVHRIYTDFKVFTYGSDFKDDTSLLVVKMK